MTSDTRKIQDRYITDIRVHRDALKNVVDILRRQGKPLGLRDKELDECDAILAADAELKRLREDIEWALENGDVVTIFGTDEPRGNWKDELRRRAKEGK